ncbi:MAG: L-asparaginase/Glu-tRNA(Gln) amidotransferase subunit D, partial [Paraglaciecola sp.]
PVSAALSALLNVAHHAFRVTKQHSSRLDEYRNSNTYPSNTVFMQVVIIITLKYKGKLFSSTFLIQNSG